MYFKQDKKKYYVFILNSFNTRYIYEFKIYIYSK